jgi:4-hydroxybenzoate polyprenyltransferase
VSENVSANASPKTLTASSKETPCFWWLLAAFLSSYSNLNIDDVDSVDFAREQGVQNKAMLSLRR